MRRLYRRYRLRHMLRALRASAAAAAEGSAALNRMVDEIRRLPPTAETKVTR